MQAGGANSDYSNVTLDPVARLKRLLVFTCTFILFLLNCRINRNRVELVND